MLQYRNNDFDGDAQESIALKELKIVHRNQTILTGGLIGNYHIDTAFDFDNIDDAIKTPEPMELDQQRRHIVSDIKDTEMISIDLQRTNGTAVRPTTLNLSGPDTIFTFLSLLLPPPPPLPSILYSTILFGVLNIYISPALIMLFNCISKRGFNLYNY